MASYRTKWYTYKQLSAVARLARELGIYVTGLELCDRDAGGRHFMGAFGMNVVSKLADAGLSHKDAVRLLHMVDLFSAGDAADAWEG